MEASKTPKFNWNEVVWYNVIILAVWHLMAVYSLLFVMPYAPLHHIALLWVGLWFISGLGITAGAHRLWSHRSYKATLPLRFFLMICNSMAFQGSIFEWSRDHRVHHKGSDTTADPHNSRRGFFFAHMGWVMVRKHQDVLTEGKKMSFDDLLDDPVVYYQKKFYLLSTLLCCYVLPTALGHAVGSAWNGFWIGAIFRHVWVLHMTWCVNSVAHFFGYRPYDRNIRPVESLLVSIGAIGEGWHNFHHKFPSDYATGEFGIATGQWNPTKAFIDLCATLGLAYDLKKSRTAASSRERVKIMVEQEKLKGILQPPSTFDQIMGWLFFGRTEDQMF